jgi:ATP-binding cassette subfamily F protein uup
MKRVATLSGGERRRLQLLTVITRRPNFLILDEPSNDLDSNSIAALEQYLEEFKGVLIVVSHDRYFTDKVTDHLFIFEGDGIITDYSGSLSDYAEILVDDRSPAFLSSVTSNSKAIQKEEKERRTAKLNLIQKYKRELASLEPALDKLKAKSIEIQKEIDKSENEGWSVLAELTKQLLSVTDEIEHKENRWLELAEALEVENSS